MGKCQQKRGPNALRSHSPKKHQNKTQRPRTMVLCCEKSLGLSDVRCTGNKTDDDACSVHNKHTRAQAYVRLVCWQQHDRHVGKGRRGHRQRHWHRWWVVQAFIRTGTGSRVNERRLPTAATTTTTTQPVIFTKKLSQRQESFISPNQAQRAELSIFCSTAKNCSVAAVCRQRGISLFFFFFFWCGCRREPLRLNLEQMGQARPSRFCPPPERMSEQQLELFKVVTERSIEQDAQLMLEKERIQQRIAATIADALTVQDFLQSLVEVRQVLACLPMATARCPEGLTPQTLLTQSAKDLCRETVIINNEEFAEHCTSDCERGSHVLKQKLLLDIFEKGVSPQHRRPGTKAAPRGPGKASSQPQAHDHETFQSFHKHKRACVDRVIRAACRTISGGDSYDEILSLFQSTHFLITP